MAADAGGGPPPIEVLPRSGWSCPECGAGFVGSPSRCLSCGHLLRPAPGAEVDPDPLTGKRPRRPILLSVAATFVALATAGLVGLKLVGGDGFPGSGTLTRSGQPVVEGQPTCDYGGVAAGCVVHHLGGDSQQLGTVTGEPFSLDTEGRVLMAADESLLLVGAEGVIWKSSVLPLPIQELDWAFLPWQSPDLLLVEAHAGVVTFFIGLDAATGTARWTVESDRGFVGEAIEGWVIDGMLVTTTYRFNPDGTVHDGSSEAEPQTITMVGHELETGREHWRRELDPRMWIDHSGFVDNGDGTGQCLNAADGSFAIVAGRHACAEPFGRFLFEDDFVLVVNPDGGETWTIPPDEQMVSYDDELVLTMELGEPGWLRVRDLDNGDERWTVRLDWEDREGVPEWAIGPDVWAVLAHDQIVLGRFHGVPGPVLAAHDRTTGELRWRVEGEPTEGDMSDLELGPALLSAGDRLFWVRDGQTMQVNPDDGSTEWSFPRGGHTVLADGERLIVVGLRDVWVIDPPA